MGKSQTAEGFHALHDATFRPRMRQQLMQEDFRAKAVYGR